VERSQGQFPDTEQIDGRLTSLRAPLSTFRDRSELDDSPMDPTSSRPNARTTLRRDA